MKIPTHLITCLLLLIGVATPWTSSQPMTLRAPFGEAINGIPRISRNDGQTAPETARQIIAAGCSIKKSARCADLDVTYIERTPRYSRYALDYRLQPGDPWGIPRLCEGTENNKRWPDEGETVTYTAHIINKGVARSSRFHFEWLINGRVVAQGTSRPIRPGAERTFEYSTTFPAAPQMIEFRVAPRGSPRKEAFASNNRLTIGSHDLTISIWIEQGLYDVFNRELNLVGTRSFEDWIQAQFAWMNERFDLSRYPVAPQGILDRVRIDKLVVAPELDADFPFPGPVCATYPADPDGFLIDGGWLFKDGDTTNSFGINEWYERYVHEPDGYVIPLPLTTPRVLGIDTGLVHELAYQLGVIDLYRVDYGPFEVTDLGGQVIPREKLPFPGICGTLNPYPGIMAGGDTTPYRDPNYFESHTAGSMNSHYNYRRGYFGEYLFDTPAQTFVELIDESGDPLADVFVQFYQKYALTDTFDNEPEIEALTDAQGRMLLPNRVPDVPVVTATGHTLRPNPFGQIFHEGSNGVMFVRAVQGGQELYGWFSLLDLNLAYWQGQTEQAEFTIQLFPPRTNSCPP
jgi:CARDB